MDGDYPNRINMSDHNSAMFGSSYSPGPPHPNFEVSEFFELEDWMEEDQSVMTSGYTTQSRHQEVTEVINSSGNCSQHANMGNSCKQSRFFFFNHQTRAYKKNVGLLFKHNKCRWWWPCIDWFAFAADGESSGQERKETKEKVAFKTKSEVEILDDGFKWRKYGKKMVKNSPNPR